MLVQELIYMIENASNNAREIMLKYAGESFDCITGDRIITDINKELEIYNQELRDELGIELYIEITPNFEAPINGYRGIPKLRKVSSGNDNNSNYEYVHNTAEPNKIGVNKGILSKLFK